MKLPTDATTAMLAALATSWATVLAQTVAMNRKLKRTVEAGPKAHAPRLWLAVSLPIFMVEGFYMLLTYADVIVLQQFRSPDEVAVYYAAAKTARRWSPSCTSRSPACATAHKFSRVPRRRQQGAALGGFLGETRSSGTFWPVIGRANYIIILAASASRSSGCSARTSSTATI